MRRTATCSFLHCFRAPALQSMCIVQAATPLAVAAALAGCMVLPRVTTSYDPDCRMVTRQVTLEAVPLGGIVLHCSNTPGSCTASLVMAGVVTSASAVVSGSIAVVGNVVYWIERQGHCIGAGASAAG